MKNINKRSIILVSISLIAGLVIYACTKENTEVANTQKNMAIVATPNQQKDLSGNLELAFNVDDFTKALEDYLDSAYGDQYMIENISAFTEPNGDGSTKPYLQISLFDTWDESSYNTFYLLDTITTDEGSLAFAVGPISLSVTCNPHGKCTRMTDGGDNPDACAPRFNNREGYCTGCTRYGLMIDPFAYCQKTASAVFTPAKLYEIFCTL